MFFLYPGKMLIFCPLPKFLLPLNSHIIGFIHSTSHLRPISILPTMSKILEYLLKEQTSAYVFTNKIIPNIQSGFREQHSTTTALLNVTDDIYRVIDNNKVCCLVLLDCSKAFDTLDHGLLCKKLSFFGFDNTSVSLIQNCLSNCSHSVLLDSEESEALPVNFGVPQGSILGPLLFSLYISFPHIYRKV